MLIDSHCHLNDAKISSNLEAILDRALQNNVQIIQTICTKESEIPEIKSIIDYYPHIYASLGVHPLEVIESNIITPDKLINYAQQSSKFISFGETGLDYHYVKNTATQQAQIQSFISHIKAAQQLSMPVIVHTREAEEDTLRVLKSCYAESPFKCIIHCFTASFEFAMRALDLGCYISASGIITFKNAEDIARTFQEIPIDRILIETDAPYLAPVPQRGKVNEPAFVKHIAEKLAIIKGLDVAEIATATSNNFQRLFPSIIVN